MTWSSLLCCECWLAPASFVFDVVIVDGGYRPVGARSWMLGRRPWKVGYTGDSPASDVAVVMVSLCDHEGGEEGTTGNPRVAAFWQRRLPDRGVES
jgi:hypothetical protein